MILIETDRFSKLIPGRKLQINLLLKTSYDREELLSVINPIEKEIKKEKVIGFGSNRFHFLTYALYSVKGKGLPYLHIDLHPDDYSIYPKINAGSFVKYLPAKEKYYIGFLKPDRKETFKDYLLIRNFEINKIEQFINKLPSNLYVSIDLDIVKRPYVINPYNKIAPLNDEEFLSLIKLIVPKAKYIDFCGFQGGKREFLLSFIDLLES